MTALPGGAADKAGNRYEYLWTAFRLVDLLEGRVSRIRLEPPGAAGQGVEFEAVEGGHTWAEQVKGSTSGSSWTVGRLSSVEATKSGNAKSVLDNALHHARSGSQFRFIAAKQAEVLETLSDRSRQTSDVDEFKSTLSSRHLDQFSLLKDTWTVTESEAWTYLQSFHVEQYSRAALERLVVSNFKSLVDGDPRAAIDDLRSFCETNPHVDLTGPLVWAHLAQRGFHRRHLAGDSGAASRLHQTVERQRRRVDAAAPDIGLVQSGNARRVHEVLIDPDGPQVVFVDGRAGQGKSTVASEVADGLDSEGWYVAVVRMDGLKEDTQTSAQVGEQSGLGPDSPGVLLAGVANGAPALLLVDQLDAVSLYSGRAPEVFETVQEILDELRSHPNVKVGLVVRTVDLDADSRLAHLMTQQRATRVTIEPLSEPEVEAKLADAGIAIPMSAATRALLRTPLHLSVYLRLSDSARAEEYTTVQALYAKYTEELRVKVEGAVGHLDWTGITQSLLDYMNEHEQLTAPVSVLDPHPVKECHALESETVLVRDRDSVAFFHESYFDYLFARAFVSSGRSLHEFLVASGQALFRRAQTRQILEHLLATDHSGFHTTTAELAAASDVRSHIKAVVADVVGVIAAPAAEDWLAIEQTAWAGDATSWRWLSLLSKPEWFDVVDRLDRWPAWLDDPHRVDRAFPQLMFAARTRPERVVELVRPFIGRSDEWRQRLKALLEWSVRPESVDLAVELFERGDLDDARGPIASNSDFWSLVYGLAQDDMGAAAKLVGAYLARGLAAARAEGSDDPFATGQLPTDSPSATIVDAIAAEVSTAYLDAVLPFVRVVAMENQYHSDERLPVGRRWQMRYLDTGYGVHSRVFNGVDTALQALAKNDPDAAAAYYEPLMAAESEELRFLACRALTESGDADKAIQWLAGDARNLLLGWADSPRWASVELIRKWSPTCSPEALAELEAAVLAYQPAWESEPQGRGQYQILSAIEDARLSDAARQRRDGFAESHELASILPPRQIIAYAVGSPVSETRADTMTDAEWMESLHEHDGDATTWGEDGKPVGGASQLAQSLEARAAKEPERFAKLALTFDADIPAQAIDHVIRAVASKIDADLLDDLCEKAATTWHESAGRTICFTAAQLPTVSERLIALVATYVTAEDPDREWAAEISNGSGLYYGGDLDTAGLNCTRGQAAYAAAAALFQSERHVDILRPVVETLAADPILAVRAATAEAVLGLMNHDRDAAYRIAETLFDAADAIFASAHTERLLTYLVMREPDRFGSLLSRGLKSDETTARRAGRVWAIADLNDRLPSTAPAGVAHLSQASRHGATEVFADNPGASAASLKVLFDDANPEIRKAAATAMRRLEDLPIHEAEELIDAFLDSTAAAESYEGLIEDLPDLRQVSPELAIRACEHAVKLAGAQLGDLRTGISMLGQPIMRVVIAAYRSTSELKERCLNLVDHLSEREAYGWRDLVDDDR